MNGHTGKTIARVQGWISPEQQRGEGPPAQPGQLGNNNISSHSNNNGGMNI